jgi:peroxiredoxin
MSDDARGIGCALFVFLLAVSGAVQGVEPGGPAPAFELPLVDAAGSVRSSSLFANHGYAFLVFWASGCPHCIEELRRCEEFYRTYGGEDVAVVGIVASRGDPLSVRGIVEASGVSFPQLRDADAEVAGSYDVPPETFAVYLVVRGGVVAAASIDPEGDVGAVMDGMLMKAGGVSETGGTRVPERRSGEKIPEARTVAEASTSSGLSFHGTERIRFLSIDSRGSDALGPYGEALTPGDRLYYRFELEMTKRVTRELRVGGLLRIGNEGKRVLASGPQYLGSEWGSAFAEIEARGLNVRLGYFPISMTPLTLMRWDWDDNPRSGGDAGCGCGASGGTLLVESLDELGPELTFEGARALYSRSDFETRVFYAVPRRAKETLYMNYRAGIDDRARYALEIYGFEGVWRRFDARAGSFWEAAVHAVGSFEDRRTVDFSMLGYPVADPWSSTWTVTVSGAVPIVRYVRLRGEVVAWNRNEEHGVPIVGGTEDISHEGSGGLGGIAFEKSADLWLKLDYLRLDESYLTPFSALSYEPNTEGLRGSARVPMPGGRVWLSLFHKRLESVREPAPDMERERIDFSGVATDAYLYGALGAGLSWLEKKAWRRGDVLPFDTYRRGLAASLHYDFGRVGVLELLYEKVTNRDTRYDYSPALVNESRSELYSVYMTVEF